MNKYEFTTKGAYYSNKATKQNNNTLLTGDTLVWDIDFRGFDRFKIATDNLQGLTYGNIKTHE